MMVDARKRGGRVLLGIVVTFVLMISGVSSAYADDTTNGTGDATETTTTTTDGTTTGGTTSTDSGTSDGTTTTGTTVDDGTTPGATSSDDGAAGTSDAATTSSATSDDGATTTPDDAATPTDASVEAPGAPLFTPDTYPRVDGSTVTQPLGVAFQSLFTGQDVASTDVVFNQTHQAYLNLINGDADLILVTSPSQDELDAAAAAGMELEVIPVVSEGFVFLTNADNPVDSLTQDQVRAIYSGQITNWKDVGGPDQPITAYQRPENSGSQTGMIDLVMGDTPLMDQPTYQIPTMVGLVLTIAGSFNGNSGSLGYSYYYFVTQMYGDLAANPQLSKIKLMKIDGVEPTPETIRSGEYPLNTAYYIVINKADAPDSPARQLANAMLAHDGQQTAMEAGYVPVDESIELPPAPAADPNALTSLNDTYQGNPLDVASTTEYVLGLNNTCTKVTRLTVSGLEDTAIQQSINDRFRAIQDDVGGIVYVDDDGIKVDSSSPGAHTITCAWSENSGGGATVFGIVGANFSNVLSLQTHKFQMMLGTTTSNYQALNVRLDTGEDLTPSDVFTTTANVAGMIQLEAQNSDNSCDESCSSNMANAYRADPDQPFWFSEDSATVMGVTIPFISYWPQVAIYKKYASATGLYDETSSVSCRVISDHYNNAYQACLPVSYTAGAYPTVQADWDAGTIDVTAPAAQSDNWFIADPSLCDNSMDAVLYGNVGIDGIDPMSGTGPTPISVTLSDNISRYSTTRSLCVVTVSPDHQGSIGVIPIQQSGTPANQIITLDPLGPLLTTNTPTISGTVTDLDGNPQQGQSINIRIGALYYYTESDIDGKWSVTTDPTFDGVQSVTVNSYGGPSYPYNNWGTAQETVYVNTTGQPTVAFTVQPAKGAGSPVMADGVDSWIGTLWFFNADATPMTGVSVEAWYMPTVPGSGSGQIDSSTLTDNGDGTRTVVFTTTEPSTYEVTPRLVTPDHPDGYWADDIAQQMAFISGPCDPTSCLVATMALSTVSVSAGQPVTATVTVNDLNGVARDGVRVDFSANLDHVVLSEDSCVTVDGSCSVTAILDRQGTYWLSAAIDGHDAESPGPIYVHSTPDLSKTTFTVDETQLEPGDTDWTTVTVLDANGNPTWDVPVWVIATGDVRIWPEGDVLSMCAGNPCSRQWPDSNGQVRIPFLSQNPGSTTVSAYLEMASPSSVLIAGVPMTPIGDPIQVTWATPPPPAPVVTVEDWYDTLQLPTEAIVGAALGTAVVSAKDSSGAPVNDVVVTFAVDGDAVTLNQSTCITGTGDVLYGDSLTPPQTGLCSVSYSAVRQGEATIHAYSDGVEANGSPWTVQVLPAYLEGTSLAVTRSAQVSDVWQDTLTATSYDQAGEPVEGVEVSFSSDDSWVSLSDNTCVTGPDGTCFITASATQAGSAVVHAYTGGHELSYSPVGLVFNPDSACAGLVGTGIHCGATLMVSSVSGGSTVRVTVPTGTSVSLSALFYHSAQLPIVMDPSLVDFEGAHITFQLEGQYETTTTTCTTDSFGSCRIPVTSTVPGDVTIRAYDGDFELTGTPLVITFVDYPQPEPSWFTVSGGASGEVPADGSSAWTGTITLTDDLGAPVTTAPPSYFGFILPDEVSASPVVNNGDGTYTVQFTSSVPGQYPITAYALTMGWFGMVNAHATLTFSDVAPTVSVSLGQGIRTLQLGSLSTIAAAVVSAVDENGDPVDGVTVDFSVEGSAVSLRGTSCVTGTGHWQVLDMVFPTTPGMCGVMYNAVSPGVAVVHASVSGTEVPGSPATITVLAAAAPPSPTVAVANKTTISGHADSTVGSAIANDIASVEVTYTVAGGTRSVTADVNGFGDWSIATPGDAVDGPMLVVSINDNGVRSDSTQVSLDVTAPGAPSVAVANSTQISGTSEAGAWIRVTGAVTGEATADENGAWLVVISAGTVPGQVSVTATDRAGNESVATLTSTDTSPDVGLSTLTLSSDHVTIHYGACGDAAVDPVTATATIVDSLGRPVADVPVSFSGDAPLIVGPGEPTVTDEHGVVSVQVSVDPTGSFAGVIQVRASVGGTDVGGSPADVTISVISADRASGGTVTMSTASTEGGAQVVTATVADVCGDGLSGVDVQFSVTGQASLSVQSQLTRENGMVRTGSDGTATVTVSDTIAETVVVTASTSEYGTGTIEVTFAGNGGSNRGGESGGDGSGTGGTGGGVGTGAGGTGGVSVGTGGTAVPPVGGVAVLLMLISAGAIIALRKGQAK